MTGRVLERSKSPYGAGGMVCYREVCPLSQLKPTFLPLGARFPKVSFDGASRCVNYSITPSAKVGSRNFHCLKITVKGVQDISADRYIYAARQVSKTQYLSSLSINACKQTIKHELLVLKQLQHPNICALLGYDQHNLRTAGVPAIVSEYCSNGTLEEVSIIEPRIH